MIKITRKRRFAGRMTLLFLILNISVIFLFHKATGSAVSSSEGESYGGESYGLAASLMNKPSALPVQKSIVGDRLGEPVYQGKKNPNETNGAASTSDPASTSGPQSTPAAGPVSTSNPGSASGPEPRTSADPGNASGTIPAVEASTQQLQATLDGIYHQEGEKTAYLTFDDGPTPSQTTPVLDILKAEGIKATFFSIGSNAERYPEMIKREYAEGHGIGSHSYSHEFRQIYSDPKIYMAEVVRCEQILKSILGQDKEFKLTRFPGGSFGKTLAPYREAANHAGYVYVDWNSLNGDAETRKPRSAKQLIARLEDTVHHQNGLVVLMHDAPGKQSTVKALPEIIHYLKSKNYRFERIPGSRSNSLAP
ncbi:polysaccharide deacetylase [Eubacteriales bacterium mix99]|nr:hypothetical protein [Clostridiales bacterium]